MKTFVALFALVAAVAAESDPQLLAGYPYGAAPLAAPAMPYAVPQVEQPSGFYYHVQTYDKTPAVPQLNAVPAVPTAPMYNAYNGWAGAYPYNNWAGAWNGAAWNGAWNGAAYNWAGAYPYATAAAWNPYWNAPLMAMEEVEAKQE